MVIRLDTAVYLPTAVITTFVLTLLHLISVEVVFPLDYYSSKEENNLENFFNEKELFHLQNN